MTDLMLWVSQSVVKLPVVSSLLTVREVSYAVSVGCEGCWGLYQQSSLRAKGTICETEHKNFALAYSNACDVNAPVFIFAK